MQEYDHHLMMLQERNRYVSESVVGVLRLIPPPPSPPSPNLSTLSPLPSLPSLPSPPSPPRLLRRLQRKSSLEVELEKREQGFALYLNGANISRRHRNQAQPSTKDKEHRTKPRERKRNSRTAGEEVCTSYTRAYVMQGFLIV